MCFVSPVKGLRGGESAGHSHIREIEGLIPQQRPGMLQPQFHRDLRIGIISKEVPQLIKHLSGMPDRLAYFLRKNPGKTPYDIYYIRFRFNRSVKAENNANRKSELSSGTGVNAVPETA